MGAFPMHDDGHRVLKDITRWRDFVRKPVIPTDDRLWVAAAEHGKAVDRSQVYAAVFWAPGIFEMTHHLMGMEDAMAALYEEPEALLELIGCVTEHELDYAEEVVRRVKPDLLFHHDDWGSGVNSFFSPDMFKEFFLPSYQKIYSFYKANGVELIVHHSDSYAANLVPYMIEMGIDIWQGAVPANNIPELIERYGEQLTFMGEVESRVLDVPDWTPEMVSAEVERACGKCGKHAFIPCLTRGLPGSAFPGVYEAADKEIDRMSREMF
jgi:uroporphyrinogen-III decarboxylase